MVFGFTKVVHDGQLSLVMAAIERTLRWRSQDGSWCSQDCSVCRRNALGQAILVAHSKEEPRSGLQLRQGG